MAKVTIEFSNHKVEFYHIPYALARAIQTMLHHVEMDSDVVSGEMEFDEEEEGNK